MKHNNLAYIKLQNIEYFLRLAKTQNMTKAADELNVTQPLLSQMLASLETAVGLKLFFRKNQRIKLSPAGVYLAQQWENLLEQIDLSVDQAYRIERRRNHVVSIGVGGTMAGQELFHVLSHNVQKDFPDITVEGQFSSAGNLIKSLKDAELDFAAVMRYNALSVSGLNEEVLTDYPLYVIVGASHPLASLEMASLNDFRDCHFIYSTDYYTPSLYVPFILNEMKRAGFSATVTSVKNSLSVYTQISSGQAAMISINKKPFADEQNRLRVVQISGSNVPYCLFWRKDLSEEYMRLIPRIKETLLSNKVNMT